MLDVVVVVGVGVLLWGVLSLAFSGGGGGGGTIIHWIWTVSLYIPPW